MSKDKTAVGSKESGAHHFKDKVHLSPDKKEGAHHNKAKGHELPSKSEGLHDVGKPIKHGER